MTYYLSSLIPQHLFPFVSSSPLLVNLNFSVSPPYSISFSHFFQFLLLSFPPILLYYFPATFQNSLFFNNLFCCPSFFNITHISSVPFSLVSLILLTSSILTFASISFRMPSVAFLLFSFVTMEVEV